MVRVRLGGVANERVDVREVGLDEGGLEASHVGEAAVKEHDVDDVVADVPLALDLGRRRRKSCTAKKALFIDVPHGKC